MYSLLQKILDRHTRALPGMKKAFTLIELIIAISVFSIFSAGAVGVLVPVMNIYTNAIQLSDARLIAYDIMGTIENELVYAQDNDAFPLTVNGDTLQFAGRFANQETYITTKNPSSGVHDYLYMYIHPRGDTGVAPAFTLYYDTPFYKRFTVQANFAVTAENVVTVTVNVLDRNNVIIYTLVHTVRPLYDYSMRA